MHISESRIRSIFCFGANSSLYIAWSRIQKQYVVENIWAGCSDPLNTAKRRISAFQVAKMQARCQTRSPTHISSRLRYHSPLDPVNSYNIRLIWHEAFSYPRRQGDVESTSPSIRAYHIPTQNKITTQMYNSTMENLGAYFLQKTFR